MGTANLLRRAGRFDDAADELRALGTIKAREENGYSLEPPF